MALKAGYFGIKRFLNKKLENIAKSYDDTISNFYTWTANAVTGVHNLVIPDFKSNAGGTVVKNDGVYVVTCGNWNYSGVRLLSGDLKAILSGMGDIKVSFEYKSDITCQGDIGEAAHLIAGTMPIEWTKYQCVVSGDTIGDIAFYNREDGKAPTISIRYLSFTLVDDNYSVYLDPVLTNKALTSSANEQKTAINAIITAATGAADFAAFKTAMGAITPVTRSLSLTKEDITEEVKEDVEPEKTVTKKRTTKKTKEE